MGRLWIKDFGYLEVDGQVEEIVRALVVLVDGPEEHALVVSVRDVLNHQGSFADEVDSIQVDDEVLIIEFASLLLLIPLIAQSSHLPWLHLLLLTSNPDVVPLVPHLLLMELAGLSGHLTILTALEQ